MGRVAQPGVPRGTNIIPTKRRKSGKEETVREYGGGGRGLRTVSSPCPRWTEMALDILSATLLEPCHYAWRKRSRKTFQKVHCAPDDDCVTWAEEWEVSHGGAVQPNAAASLFSFTRVGLIGSAKGIRFAPFSILLNFQ